MLFISAKKKIKINNPRKFALIFSMKILKQKVRSLQKYNKLKYPVRYMYNAENCEKL